MDSTQSSDERQPTGAELAGTAGGASAGANDGGLGDLESNARPDDDITDEALSQPGAGLENTTGPTSGSTVGGMTVTSGSGGITTSGGADTSPTND